MIHTTIPTPRVSTRVRLSVRAGLATLVLAALATVAAAAQESAGMPQGGALAQQNLRPYWHVFAAYTLVIVMVGAWAISIARRLRSVEQRLSD